MLIELYVTLLTRFLYYITEVVSICINFVSIFTKVTMEVFEYKQHYYT